MVGEKTVYFDPFIGQTYELLHKFTQKNIIPVIRQKKVTIAVVELTTCGLLSDLLTAESGASKFFSFGIIPYTSKSKIMLNIPKELLEYRGPGTVSAETAETLATNAKNLIGANIGIAETGLLPSVELSERRTKKKAGLIFLSIVSTEHAITKKLEVHSDLTRRFMRFEVALRVLQHFFDFLKEY